MRTLVFLLFTAGIGQASADATSEVGAIVSEVDRMDLVEMAIEVDVERATSISLFRDRDSMNVRKVGVSMQIHDHHSTSQTIYFDADGHVRSIGDQLVYEQGGIPDEGDHTATITDRHFEFDPDGNLIRALTRSFRGALGPALSASAERADNKRLAVGTLAANRILTSAAAFSEIPDSREPAAAVGRLSAALALLADDDPPDSPTVWQTVDHPDGATFPKDLPPTGAASAFLRGLGVALDGEEAPPIVWVDALGPDGALVTLHNLQDDSVRSIRYRIEFEPTANGERAPALVLQQFRCWEGRGHDDWSKEPCG